MRLLKWLDKSLEESIMLILLAEMVIVMGLQIVMRYVFNSSLSWPEELTRYCFIWLSFLGMSYSIKEGGSLRIDILEGIFPKLKTILQVLGDIMYFLFCLYLVPEGMATIQKIMQTGQRSAAMQLPMWIVYSSLLIGLILTCIRIIQKYVKQILAKRET